METNDFLWDPHWLKPLEERTLLGDGWSIRPPDTELLARLISDLDKLKRS